MKNKKRKLRAASYTFLALLGGVMTATILAAPLVSCNKIDYYGKQKAVISDIYSSNVSIAEQKSLDNGDMKITLNLPSGQYLQRANISAKGSLKETEYKVSSSDGTITIFDSALKSHKYIEKFVISPYLNIKVIQLDKTSINLKKDESTTLKVTLPDGAKKEINAKINGDTSCIIIDKGEDDNTVIITGLQKNSKYTWIEFSCDDYTSAVCSITITE